MAVASTALVTLSTVKTELSLSSSTDDSYLERLINSTSTFVERYCNRTLSYSASISEKAKGFGTSYLRVARPPLRSITSLSYDGTALSTSDYEVQSTNGGVIIHIGGRFVWTTLMNDGLIAGDGVPGFERKLYTIVYAGGWVTQPQKDADGTLPARDLPYDIEDAAIQIVTWRYRNRGTDPTIGSESLMDYSVSYKVPGVVGTKDFLQTTIPGAAALLASYRLPAWA